MKKILITGINSYIGTSFENWLKQWPDEYKADKISVRDDEWKEKDFSKYDVVLHVAGIAHVSTDPKMEELYYKVNRDLTIEIAKKAKLEGVNQFIFMSSIIVYGDSAPIGEKKYITSDTEPNPANFYGDSKLQADLQLKLLSCDKFKVCILRPPMIYGPGSKGNYQILSKLAGKLLVFPDINNERSILYIGNLNIFIKECIDEIKEGIYHPENEEYVSTSQLVKLIAKAKGKNIYITKLINPLVYLISKIPGRIGGMCNKAFGSMTYSKECNISKYKIETSIEKTEEINNELL